MIEINNIIFKDPDIGNVVDVLDTNTTINEVFGFDENENEYFAIAIVIRGQWIEDVDESSIIKVDTSNE